MTHGFAESSGAFHGVLFLRSRRLFWRGPGCPVASLWFRARGAGGVAAARLCPRGLTARRLPEARNRRAGAPWTAHPRQRLQGGQPRRGDVRNSSKASPFRLPSVEEIGASHPLPAGRGLLKRPGDLGTPSRPLRLSKKFFFFKDAMKGSVLRFLVLSALPRRGFGARGCTRNPQQVKPAFFKQTNKEVGNPRPHKNMFRKVLPMGRVGGGV